MKSNQGKTDDPVHRVGAMGLFVFNFTEEMLGEVIVPPSKKLEDLLRLSELCVDLLRQNEEFYAEVGTNIVCNRKNPSPLLPHYVGNLVFRCFNTYYIIIIIRLFMFHIYILFIHFSSNFISFSPCNNYNYNCQ